MRWRVTISVWPYSTGKGQAVDKAAAGAAEGDLYFYCDAENFRDAVKFAECFARGVKANPAVWEAPIMGVHRCDEK